MTRFERIPVESALIEGICPESKMPYSGSFLPGPARIMAWWVRALARAGALGLFLIGVSGFAAETPSGVQLNLSLNGPDGPMEISAGLQLLLLFTALSLAPALVVMTTSFTRIVVVLSFLRTALGIQQPSGQLLIGLSLFLTGFIMFPVWNQINREALIPLREKKIKVGEALDRASLPLKQFMLRQTRQKDLELFTSMAPDSTSQAESAGDSPAEKLPLQVVIPAFMVSELRAAFQMGFVIFLPFLIIDMVVASILMAMGMMMLPPAMVTLPLKILIFVLADGWGLVVRSLVTSFQ